MDKRYNLYLNGKLIVSNAPYSTIEDIKINEFPKYSTNMIYEKGYITEKQKFEKGTYTDINNKTVDFRIVEVSKKNLRNLNNIKSFSISVPATGCINDCKYCVSKMKGDWKHFGTNEDFLDDNTLYRSMKYAIENGAKSIIITGTVEPLQNMEFIHRVCKIFKEIDPPTVSLEIQTSLCYGAMTIPYIKKLAEWGVDTLAVSVSALNEKMNWEISGVAPNRYTSIIKALKYATSLGMNTRVCINMSQLTFVGHSGFELTTSFDILTSIAYRFGGIANQITIRRLYHDNSDTPQANWIKENEFDESFWTELKELLSKEYCKIGEVDWYDVDCNFYIRVDEDCMGKQDESRYWVLRPNGKIYAGWDATEPIEIE